MKISLNRARAVAAIAICAWFLPGVTRAEDTPSQKLRQLMEQYDHIKTVDMKASYTATYVDYADQRTAALAATEKMVTRNDKGIYSYAAEGAKYDVVNTHDSHALPNTDFHVVFDGERWASLDMQMMSLDYKKGDTDQLPMISIPPLFYPVEFFDELTYHGRHWPTLKLSRVQDPLVQEEMLKVVKWSKDNSGLDIADLPGPALEDLPATVFRIHFGPTGYLPVKIERTSPDRTPPFLWVWDFADYRRAEGPGEPFFYPRSIKRTVTMTKTKLVTTLENIVIEKCQINEPSNDSRFTLDFRQAKYIYDIDTKRHLDAPAPSEIVGLDSSATTASAPATQPAPTNTGR